MSELFQRIETHYRTGLESAPPELWIDPRIHDIAHFTPAAVLMAVTERPDPGVLLLHRPSNMRAHPGQIAFPGGRIDPGEDAVEAALREAWEELGIASHAVRIVGPVDRYRTGSGYEITPVLAVVPPDIEITPNPMEVAQWFEAPLDFVLNPANHVPQTIDWEGRQHTFLEIMWQEHCIWGVTAAILSNLAKRLNWHA